MSKNLDRILNPRSIAVFGGAWAQNVIVQLQKSNFSGDIWPVHPNRKEICGLPCFTQIDALPAAPDAAFVGVNRELTVEIIGELNKRGAGGAICFASGFMETRSGADLQKRLVDAAGDMPILGPNCYGLLNYLDNATLWPDQHGGRSVDRGVAIVGQSSNILINMTMQKRGLPIAYTIAAGNQAQIGLSEIASALLDDDRVSAVGLYIEGFGDIRAFEAMAEKAQKLGKPMVAIKTGKSEKSHAATMTHTASLAGSAAAASAFLKRLGIIEVPSIAVFLETLKLLHVLGPLSGPDIVSLSCSGGEAGLISDMADGTSINFREFSDHTHQQLADILGPLVTIANPFDYHTFIWADRDRLKATYSAAFGDGHDLAVLIMDIPPEDRCDMSAWEIPLASAIAAKTETHAKVALLTTLPENLSEEISDRLLRAGIVPLHGMEEAITAIDAMLRSCSYTKQPIPPALLADKARTSFEVLDEARSKKVLALYGLNFPKSVNGKTVADIESKVAELTFPIALKGLGIAHKSEAGAVALNLSSPEAVCRSAASMNGVSGFLAEEMITGTSAEILIGITRDETGLYVLTIGAGGILTELLADTASVIVPASREELDRALSSLKLNRLLESYRGKPKADREAVLDALEAVQAYCLANPSLIELDVNPLMALPEGAIAVDALIKLET